MQTTAETLAVNGVVLNTLAKNIESLAGRLRRAQLRSENVTVPGRNGDLWTPNKKYDTNVLALPMWVRGCDDDGLVPASGIGRVQFYQNLDALTSLFSSETLLDIRHTLPDNSVRQAFGEVLDVIDVDTSGGGWARPVGKFGVSLTLPYPFFSDVNAVSTTYSGLVTNGASTLALTPQAGSTAPIEDAMFVFNGPWNNPSITSGRTKFQYLGNIAAGQSLVVNCNDWTLGSSGGLVVDPRLVSYSGDARWFVIVGTSGTPVISYASTGGITAASSLTVQAKRKFLVG